MPHAASPTVLIVLDGWGYSDSVRDNAIAAAETPNWDRLWANAPHTLISGSGPDVGLPEGQMGNSEVGHMNLGAGRIVYQDLTRINLAIEDGSFFDNPVLSGAADAVQRTGGRLHILGLLSPGGVHSHERQIAAMVELATRRGLEQVHVHAFLDGRDTPPRSAAASIEWMEGQLATLGAPPIASICGRYYAMDRDQRWDRIERAWRLLTRGEAEFEADSAAAALELAYARGESDEFVQPTRIAAPGRRPASIAEGDAVVFMNFRADRARQLSRVFLHEDFDAFARGARPRLSSFVTLTHYADDIEVPCAFPPDDLKNSIGEYLASLGLRQLRIAETEKYAHVTFFFSGGRETPFAGEQRILVPSPRVATYDLQPEMSAREVTDRLIEAITGGEFAFIVCNFANGDMVGHTGMFEAAVSACGVLDECIGRIVEALAAAGGQCLITADHGNVECMKDPRSGQPHTAHTSGPVPLVYCGPRAITFAEGGLLSDVAPTLLALMDLSQPAEMTGRSLIAAEAAEHRATAS